MKACMYADWKAVGMDDITTEKWWIMKLIFSGTDDKLRKELQMGLHLRQAMLINGMLYNSEAWHNLNNDHIRMLEEVDNHLLRSMFKSHPKTSTAFLHLETATLPIRFIIASRRLNYLHNIYVEKMTKY